MSYIPLERAYLCPDCSNVGNDAEQCHACTNRCGLMNLAAVLDRDPITIEIRAICSEFRDLMKEAPFAA